MRRIVCIVLTLMLLGTLAVPAMASDDNVIFTSGSKAEVGGYLELDMIAMMLSDKASSEVYNAILEHNYEIYWYRNGAFYSTKERVSFTDADAGATFSVEIRFYGDKACTVLWATIVSKEYVIKSDAPPMELKTTAVPDGAVDMYYSFQFESSDPNAAYSLYRTSAPDGLTLDAKGYLSGIPTKAGTFQFTVVVTGKGGEAMKDYTMQIGGEMFVTKITTESLPNATAGEAYHAELACSDPNATFGIYYNPGKSNDFSATGLALSNTGKITGIPTKAGTYTFWVGAYGTSEDHYKEFTLTVLPGAAPTEPPTEPTQAPTVPPTEPPTQPTQAPTVPPTEPTQASTAPPTQPSTQATEGESGGKKPGVNKGDKIDKVDKTDKTDSGVTTGTTGKVDAGSEKTEGSNGLQLPWWGIAAIAAGSMILGVVMALIIGKGKRSR